MNNQVDSFTYREIMSQGQSWEATLLGVDSLDAGVVAAAAWPAETLFIGCGSTYYLSLSAALFWSKLTGLPARALPASELWLYPDCVLARREPARQSPVHITGGEGKPYLLVAISRSGETTETLRAMDIFRKGGAGKCVAVTCYGESALARRADLLLLTRGAEEESVAQTRSFTSMYLLLQATACLVADQPELRAQLGKTSSNFLRLVEEYQLLVKGLAENDKFEQMVFLGSGVNYGLACEAMLKMKEMSLTHSEAFHFMEFRHGPKSVVGPGTLIVGLVDESAKSLESKVLAELRSLGATILAISESEKELAADYQISLRSGLDYLASRVLTLPLLQLMAYYRSVHKGLDPDRPTNLDAVVRLV
jgi:glucosamine--fructose-6-phosphate aminotransferase (isomerizing)